MSMYTSQAPGIGTHGILDSQIGALVIEPIRQTSVAFGVSTVVPTSENQFRIPRLTADAGVAWVSEGSEISPDDVEMSELVLTPLKVAGLTVISACR
jgi:HK97 family phage major capsid protein